MKTTMEETTMRKIYCHGCGEEIENSAAIWHGGEGYCAGCESAPSDEPDCYPDPPVPQPPMSEVEVREARMSTEAMDAAADETCIRTAVRRHHCSRVEAREKIERGRY